MKLIASWGSPGAGKTTVALAMAAQLQMRHMDVLVLGMDTRTPMLPVYLPNDKLGQQNSLGAVFEQQTITEAALKDKLLRHPQSDRIYFAGLVGGELYGITYRIPERDMIQQLMAVLQQSPFAACIVDCDSTPVLEPVTLLALERADVVLRCVTPDVRGHESMASQLQWLSNSDDTFRLHRHKTLLNPVYPYTPLADVRALEGAETTALPWSRQVAERQLAGKLLCRFDEAAGREFERQISQIIEEALHG